MAEAEEPDESEDAGQTDHRAKGPHPARCRASRARRERRPDGSHRPQAVDRRSVPVRVDANLSEPARTIRGHAVLAAVRPATEGATQDESPAAPLPRRPVEHRVRTHGDATVLPRTLTAELKAGGSPSATVDRPRRPLRPRHGGVPSQEDFPGHPQWPGKCVQRWYIAQLHGGSLGG